MLSRYLSAYTYLDVESRTAAKDKEGRQQLKTDREDCETAFIYCTFNVILLKWEAPRLRRFPQAPYEPPGANQIESVLFMSCEFAIEVISRQL